MKRFSAFLLAGAMLFCGALSGCTAPASSATALAVDLGRTGTEFAVRLLQTGDEPGENVLFSPVCLLYTLSMTANGADGDTLDQMEDTLNSSVSYLNNDLQTYRAALPQAGDCRLHLANSLWLADDDRLAVKPEFLEVCKTKYGAEVQAIPFDDSAPGKVNRWVEENTDGMIPEILDEISDTAVMYLLSAVAFDAEWQQKYFSTQPGVFTAETGEAREAEMMYAHEELYLEDDSATGFLKPYADPRYAFAVLLPNEGVELDEYIASLDGGALYDLLNSPQEVTVQTAIPKFETAYSTELNDILAEMGMPDAFNPDRADFSRMGDTKTDMLYISQVLHKTFLSVTPRGTRAGAASLVEMEFGGSPPAATKQVILDRPSAYMILDRQEGVPLFLGVLRDTQS